MISDKTNYQIPRLANYQILASALLVVAFAAIVAVLAAGLRPDAFFVGDPGIKLIAAKNANTHPDRPLDIPLPVIDRESLPYVEPFFETHGDHAHAVTTDLFPLITARFIRWFGLRGAFVLPAVGFLGILVGCAWLAVALDSRRSPALVVLIAAIAAPFLFYGLEFWEHAPAVAIATNATALFVLSLQPRRGRAAMALASGLAFGIAFLLRPEMGWALLAVLIGSVALDTDETHPNRRILFGLLTLTGALLALAPLEIYTLRHFGRIMPAHLGANAAVLQTSWLAERVHLLATWLVPSAWTRSGPAHPETIWTAAPLILLALVPIRTDAARAGRQFMWIVAALVVVLVWLTAPNDGGAQWSPRYLLFAFVPLVVLAADAVEALPRRTTTLVALGALLIACLFLQRSAYRELRSTKNTYGRIVDFLERQIDPGGFVVTDLWWLDQVGAAATSDRRLVYVPDDASGHAVLQRLSRATVAIVIVVRSETESPSVSAWRDDTCYVEIKRETIDVRRVVAITLHHRCST